MTMSYIGFGSNFSLLGPTTSALGPEKLDVKEASVYLTDKLSLNFFQISRTSDNMRVLRGGCDGIKIREFSFARSSIRRSSFLFGMFLDLGSLRSNWQHH
jgi:hypothetical protein